MLGGTKTKKADALSKLASMTFEQLTKEVLVEVLAKGLINDKEVSKVEAKRGENWMIPIFEYLLSGLLWEDQKEARKIIIKALHTSHSQSDNIIKEVHKGSCRFNMKSRSLVVRIMKQGYYWSMMHRDAAKIIEDYTQCQEYSALRKVSSKDSISSGNTWPFSH
ncbi:hypothetical protein Tco_0558407 [Tanacetum coccineum]